MRKTFLHDEHLAGGGKVVDFHGWAMPVQFKSILVEHSHTREKASLFDCSHMGEFCVKGMDALRAFDSLTCSGILALKVGRCRYGALLNSSGRIIDDIVTIKLAEDELYVVTNAGPLDEVSAKMTSLSGEVVDLSDGTSKIDIQGPLSRDILVELGFSCVSDLKFYTAKRAEWNGSPIVVSRAGYTGELGFELYVPNDLAVELWRLLLGHGDVEPAGLGARDTLRTEMGYSLSGQDIDETRTPLESGMTPLIAWDTDFVGKDALSEMREKDDYQLLTGIRSQSRRAPRSGQEVKKDGEVVGVVTSGTFGPSVGVGVGLAYVPKELAAAGTELNVGPKDMPVETADRPFYKHGTCRIK